MLSKILSKEKCASCKFCCSFRRQSLWETPIFSPDEKSALEKKFPQVIFIPRGKSFTYDLLPFYKTEDPEEEVKCPFLGKNGCILSKEEKPFDCSIWPLRIIRKNQKTQIVYENICPGLKNTPIEEIRDLVFNDLYKIIEQKVTDNPDIIKSDNFQFLEL